MSTENPFAHMNFSDEEQLEIDKLLQEGEDLEDELDLHPIVRQTLHLCLEEDGETWRSELDEDRQAAIVGFLDEIQGDKSMKVGKAVFDLIRVSVYLDQTLNVGKSAYQIFGIANDAVIRFDLMSTVNAVERSEAGKHDKLMGKETNLTAPKMDEEKPKGTLSLDQLTGGRFRA